MAELLEELGLTNDAPVSTDQPAMDLYDELGINIYARPAQLQQAQQAQQLQQPEQPQQPGQPTGMLIPEQSRKNWLTAFEEVAEHPLHYVPYLNATDLIRSGKLLIDARAVKTGTASPDQQRNVQMYLADQSRKTSFGYDVVSGVLGMIPFMGELLGAATGIGAAASGGKIVAKEAAEVGLEAISKTLLKDSINFAAKEAAGEGVAGWMKYGVAKTIAAGVSKIAPKLAMEVGESEVLKYGALKAAEKLGKAGAAEKLAEFMATEAGKQIAGKSVKELAVLAAKKIGLETATYEATTFAQNILKPTFERMMPNVQMTPDQQGNLAAIMTNDGDGFMSAMLKTVYGTSLNVAAAQLGDLLYMGHALWGKGIYGESVEKLGDSIMHSAPMKSAFMSAMTKMWARGMETPQMAHMVDTLRDAGWQGYFGNQATLIAAGIAQGHIPSLPELAAQAVSFAVFPVAIAGSAIARGQITAREMMRTGELTDALFPPTGGMVSNRNIFDAAKGLQDELLAERDRQRFAIGKWLPRLIGREWAIPHSLDAVLAEHVERTVPELIERIKTASKPIAGPEGIQEAIPEQSRLLEAIKGIPDGSKPAVILRTALNAALKDPSYKTMAYLLDRTVFLNHAKESMGGVMGLEAEWQREKVRKGELVAAGLDPNSKQIVFRIASDIYKTGDDLTSGTMKWLQRLSALPTISIEQEQALRKMELTEIKTPEDRNIVLLGATRPQKDLIGMLMDVVAAKYNVIHKELPARIVEDTDRDKLAALVAMHPDSLAKHDVETINGKQVPVYRVRVDSHYNPETNEMFHSAWSTPSSEVEEVAHLLSGNPETGFAKFVTSLLGKDGPVYSALEKARGRLLGERDEAIARDPIDFQIKLMAKANALTRKIDALNNDAAAEMRVDNSFAATLAVRRAELEALAKGGAVKAMKKQLESVLRALDRETEKAEQRFGTEKPEMNLATIEDLIKQIKEPGKYSRELQELASNIAVMHMGFADDGLKDNFYGMIGLDAAADKQLGKALSEDLGPTVYDAVRLYAHGKEEARKEHAFGAIQAGQIEAPPPPPEIKLRGARLPAMSEGAPLYEKMLQLARERGEEPELYHHVALSAFIKKTGRMKWREEVAELPDIWRSEWLRTDDERANVKMMDPDEYQKWIHRKSREIAFRLRTLKIGKDAWANVQRMHDLITKLSPEEFEKFKAGTRIRQQRDVEARMQEGNEIEQAQADSFAQNNPPRFLPHDMWAAVESAILNQARDFSWIPKEIDPDGIEKTQLGDQDAFMRMVEAQGTDQSIEEYVNSQLAKSPYPPGITPRDKSKYAESKKEQLIDLISALSSAFRGRGKAEEETRARSPAVWIPEKRELWIMDHDAIKHELHLGKTWKDPALAPFKSKHTIIDNFLIPGLREGKDNSSLVFAMLSKLDPESKLEPAQYDAASKRIQDIIMDYTTVATEDYLRRDQSKIEHLGDFAENIVPGQLRMEERKGAEKEPNLQEWQQQLHEEGREAYKEPQVFDINKVSGEDVLDMDPILIPEKRDTTKPQGPQLELASILGSQQAINSTRGIPGPARWEEHAFDIQTRRDIEVRKAVRAGKVLTKNELNDLVTGLHPKEQMERLVQRSDGVVLLMDNRTMTAEDAAALRINAYLLHYRMPWSLEDIQGDPLLGESMIHHPGEDRGEYVARPILVLKPDMKPEVAAAKLREFLGYTKRPLFVNFGNKGDQKYWQPVLTRAMITGREASEQPILINPAYARPLAKLIAGPLTITESRFSEYSYRTALNAHKATEAGGATVALMVNETTAGSGLTAKLAKEPVAISKTESIPGSYIPVNMKEPPNKAARRVAEELKSKSKQHLPVLNIAGNGLKALIDYDNARIIEPEFKVWRKAHKNAPIEEFENTQSQLLSQHGLNPAVWQKKEWRKFYNETVPAIQERANRYVMAFIKNLMSEGITIGKIISGGQNGIDEAGAHAGLRAGIPVEITFPRWFKQAHPVKGTADLMKMGYWNPAERKFETGKGNFYEPYERYAKDIPEAKRHLNVEPIVESDQKSVKPGADLGTLPMYYPMKAEQIRTGLRAKYPQGAKTTAELIAAGDRTATTRRPFGAVGDTFAIRDIPGRYRITAIEQVNLDTPEGREQWSRREGWDVDAAMQAYPNQVRTGAIQTVFEKIVERPQPESGRGAIKVSSYGARVEKLAPNEVFVFGSNLNGFHGAGSAGYASFGKPGNIWREEGYGGKPMGWKGKWNVKGQGEGLQIGTEGQSYALPTVTKAGAKNSLTPNQIKANIKRMYDVASEHPELIFKVAGDTGGQLLNGYTHPEMLSFYQDAGEIPSNIQFSDSYAKELQSRQRATLNRPESEKPTATFIGYQETGKAGESIPLYNIHGGERDGSTVSADTLRELGIPIPEEHPGMALLDIAKYDADYKAKYAVALKEVKQRFPIKEWMADELGIREPSVERARGDVLKIAQAQEVYQRAIGAHSADWEAAMERATHEALNPIQDGQALYHAKVLEAPDLVSESVRLAKDLKERLEKQFSVKPMPEKFELYGMDFYKEKGTWYQKDSKELKIISEKEAQSAWTEREEVRHPEADYKMVAQVVHEWKRDHGIRYDPQEAYAKGEGFYHDIGAFNQDGKHLFSKITSALLAQSRRLHKGEVLPWDKPEEQVIVSGYTAKSKEPEARQGWSITKFNTVEGSNEHWQWFPTEEAAKAERDRLEQTRLEQTIPLPEDWEWQVGPDPEHVKTKSVRPSPGSLRLVIRPPGEDIIWAAVGDVYSGTAIDPEWRKNMYKPTINPKAPQADKLGLLANSISAAIEGRRPQNYNELGLRVKIGTAYIQCTDGVPHPATDEELRKYGYPEEAIRLQKYLLKTFQRVHGSLDAVAPYEPKTIERAGGVREQFHARDISKWLLPESTTQFVGSQKLHEYYKDWANKVRAAQVLASAQEMKWRKQAVDKDGKSIPNLFEAITMAREGRELNKTPGYETVPSNTVILKGHEKLAKEIYDGFDKGIAEVNDLAKSFNEDAWIKYLNHYMPHFWAAKEGYSVSDVIRKWREETGRTEQRRIPTIQEGMERGLVPITLDAAKLYRMWIDETYQVALHNQLLHISQNFIDNDGNPLIIGIRSGATPEELKARGPYLPPTPADESLAYMLTDRLGALLKGTDKAGYRARLAKPFEALSQVLAQNPHLTREYVKMDSPYKSWDHFLVHPDAVNTMKMLLDQRWDSGFWRAVDHYNAWSKAISLSLSAFHYAAVTESFWSAMAHKMGSTERGLWNAMKGGMSGKLYEEYADKPEIMKKWVEASLRFQTPNDYDTGLIGKDLDAIKGVASALGVKWAVDAIQKAKNFNDKKLWRDLHGGLKLWGAETLEADWIAKHLAYGPEELTGARKDIASYLNAVTGGMDMNKFMWATPKMKQLLHLFIFAPDWSMSNIVTAGLGKGIGYTYSKYEREQLAKNYWPAMLATIVAMPNILQAGIYAAFGNKDDSDEPLSVDNEAGKQYSVDISPITRKLGLGGIAGKDRYYLRYGKQAWEIAGLLNNPLTTLMAKTSLAFKTVFEQATGTNTSGWDLPFKDEGFWRSAVDGSRTKEILKKFVPMSLSTLWEGKPSSFFAPISRGMTPAKAERMIGQVLETYAQPETWDKIQGKPEYQKNLAGLVPEILDAAARNGIDPHIVMAQGKRYIISRAYNEFFKAINSGDLKLAEKWAQSVIRLGGTLKSMDQSLAKKYERAGVQEGVPAAQQQAIEQVRQRAQEDLGISPAP